MAKRGYKLQEFVAHSANVNCLCIGKKARRLFVTGGDDYKVNLWTIGKPTSLMSPCGHTSPIESVAFDSAEVLVLAGALSGGMKLWDLNEAKSSADKTMKFWDLESFEMIGSARCEDLDPVTSTIEYCYTTAGSSVSFNLIQVKPLTKITIANEE